MLLGQCMQAQSGISGSSSADASLSKLAIRQCKLTELLFSNSFHQAPSSLTLQQPRPQQQKAIMIVTADPRGDFNATSQILKYSALAKETTVPRIPSVTSTFYSHNSNMFTQPSRPAATLSTPSYEEIARLTTELDILRLELEEERRLRQEMEASWSRAEERIEGIEAEVREECWSEFEAQMLTEREHWRVAWEEERERNEGHVDSKLELLMQGIRIDDDDDRPQELEQPAEEKKGEGEKETKMLVQKVEGLEAENHALKARVLKMERERLGTTPSRKVRVLKARPWNVDEAENVSP